MPFLVLNGKREHLFPVRKQVVKIGRGLDQDIILPNERASISRTHAELTQDDEGYQLKDLGSRNGTFVNGKRLEPFEGHLLSDGDDVMLGEVKLRYVLLEPRPDYASNVVRSLHPTALLDKPSWTADMRTLSPADQRLALLLQLGEAVRQSSEIPALLEQLVRVVFSTLQPERVYIGVHDAELDQWKHELALTDRGKRAEDFHRSTHLINWVMREGRAFVTGDARIDSSAPLQSQTIVQANIRSAMCCPIPEHSRTIGILYVDDRERTNAYEEVDLKFLTFLGIFAGTIISSALRQDLDRRRSMALEPFEDVPVFGDTPTMRSIREKLANVAPTNIPILLLGETGTGKTMMAREIHRNSLRKDGPFVAVNCAAIPESLLESELFGYSPRSGIANANPKGKKGRFELADRGTLFLDEIGDMPLTQQSKILDVIETKRLHRLGGTSEVKINVRILAATSRVVDGEDTAGTMRSDLYFRLSRVTLTMPPLRERREDIPALCKHALGRISQEIPKRIKGISREALELLTHYSWPGNIRELDNCLTQAIIHCPPNEDILPRHLPDKVVHKTEPVRHPVIEFTRDAAELNAEERAKRDQLVSAVQTTGSLTKAAKELGISKQWAIKLARKYGVKVKQPRSH